MTIKDAAITIKEQVSAQELAALYGYQPNRGGYIGCPFHGEKTPSLKLHRSGWYCYGCGAGGSVIDFVMRHEQCSFAMAVRAIDKHFRLGLMDDKDKSLTGLLREKEARAQFEQDKADMLRLVQEQIGFAEAEYDVWWKVYHDAESTSPTDRTAKQWWDWENAKQWCLYYEDQKRMLYERLEEVKTWRMETSKARSS